MKKLRTLIRYECELSWKYIWVFYLALVIVVPAVYGLIYLLTHNTGGISCLEMNSMILVGVVGILQMNEDFRMLMQNGFTRAYIFSATVAQFAFISGLMSLIDTAAGIILRRLLSGLFDYNTIFGSLYGYGHPAVLGWLWLFLVYLLISSLGFFFALVINRVPKKLSVFAGTILAALLMLGIPFLFVAVSAPWEAVGHSILRFAVRCFGFMDDGTVRLTNPIILLLLCIGILSAGSYLIIRRTELIAVRKSALTLN